MAFSAQVMQQARLRYQQQQREAEAAAEQLRSRAYELRPRLRTLDNQLRLTVAQVMASAFQKREDPETALNDARQTNQAAQRERDVILRELDLPDYLDMGARCPDCGGTGWQGQSLCGCLRAVCRRVQLDQLAKLPGADAPGFDSFRLDVYSSEINPRTGISPRDNMALVLQTCRRWTGQFGAQSPSLLMMGGTGLGKTLLSACIARTLTEQDVGVTYVRAGELLREYEQAQFGSQPRPMQYEQAELLIVDDLGTEMSTQFTNAVMYSLLDSRLLAQKPTVISTNLESRVLQQRYPPQLISRLLGRCQTLVFFGDDLRMKG